MKKEDLIALIQGTVLDSSTASPWPGVEVHVQGRNYRTETDEAGRYELPYYWQTHKITVMFLAPNIRVRRQLITTRDILVNRGDVVTVNLEADATRFEDPPLELFRGEFSGRFSWGFECSSFKPEGGTIRAPDGSLRSINDAWVEFLGRAREHTFRPNRHYKVRWLGELTGPGGYGHLGAADYLMKVREVIGQQEEPEEW